MKVQSKNAKVLRRITTELKKETIGSHEHGTPVTFVALEHKTAKLTTVIALKNKDAIKGIKVIQSGRRNKNIDQAEDTVQEEVEKLLLVWLSDKQLQG